MNPNKFYTPNEIEEETGVPARRTRSAINEGALPASDFGGSWSRVLGADFLAWAKNTRIKPKPTMCQRVERRVDRKLREEQSLRAS